MGVIRYDETFRDDPERGRAEDQADAFIERETRVFLPGGYGTRLRAEKQADGAVRVTGSRSSSCD